MAKAERRIRPRRRVPSLLAEEGGRGGEAWLRLPHLKSRIVALSSGDDPPFEEETSFSKRLRLSPSIPKIEVSLEDCMGDGVVV